jgi:predicted lipoprotein
MALCPKGYGDLLQGALVIFSNNLNTSNWKEAAIKIQKLINQAIVKVISTTLSGLVQWSRKLAGKSKTLCSSKSREVAKVNGPPFATSYKERGIRQRD